MGMCALFATVRIKQVGWTKEGEREGALIEHKKSRKSVLLLRDF